MRRASPLKRPGSVGSNDTSAQYSTPHSQPARPQTDHRTQRQSWSVAHKAVRHHRSSDGPGPLPVDAKTCRLPASPTLIASNPTGSISYRITTPSRASRVQRCRLSTTTRSQVTRSAPADAEQDVLAVNMITGRDFAALAHRRATDARQFRLRHDCKPVRVYEAAPVRASIALRAAVAPPVKLALTGSCLVALPTFLVVAWDGDDRCRPAVDLYRGECARYPSC